MDADPDLTPGTAFTVERAAPFVSPVISDEIVDAALLAVQTHAANPLAGQLMVTLVELAPLVEPPPLQITL